MDELTMFVALRPDDSVSDAELAALRAELFADDGPAEPGADEPDRRVLRALPVETEPRRHRERRRHAVTVAAAVVVLGVAGLWVVSDRDGGTSPTPPAADRGTTTATTGAPLVQLPPGDQEATEPTTTVREPVDTIDWKSATDLGSMARSQVDAVTAGPGGFVATGMGFDDGRNQGRLWFSADGMHWQEPALDLFDAKSVTAPVATADAYFVVAKSNPDRLGLTEGSPGPADARLYRSVDGRHWEPWGEPWGQISSIASTGQVLLRGDGASAPVWSRDGLTWHATAFPDGLGEHTYFDLRTGGVTVSDGIAYLRGFQDDRFTLWSSTDGSRWQQLPDPPAGGAVAPVPGGIVVVSNPRERECNDLVNDAFDEVREADGAASVSAAADALHAQCACTARPDVHRYDTGTQAWTLAATKPGETPVIPPVARVGNTLIAAVTDADRGMTVWTAPIDTLTWEPHPGTRLDFDAGTGSPGSGGIATWQDTAVIITGDRLVGGETAVLVGTRR